MPINQCILVQHSLHENEQKHGVRYGIEDEFSSDYYPEKYRRFNYVRILEGWSFGHEKKLKLGKWTPHFDFGEYLRSDDESGTELVATIKRKMNISKNDANMLKNKLFEEIDQIAQSGKVQPLAQDEKESLVLAIMKTADHLARKALEK